MPGRAVQRFNGEARQPYLEERLRTSAVRGRLEASGSPSKRRLSLTLLDKPSIAVLPIQNMSGDPEQEYFADGIVEDIITALSRE